MRLSTNTVAAAVVAVAPLAGVLFSEDQFPLLYSICSALFTSAIFYSITVVVPETRTRRKTKDALRKQYRSFKRRCIDLFLIASGSQDYQHRDNLLDHQEFRRYFSIQNSNRQTRWDLVATSVDDQDYIFNEIVMELDFFDREIEFARGRVEMDDTQVEQFFVNFRQVVHSIKSAEAHSDDYKPFCRTLWSIFTLWNFVDGQLEEDIVGKMINDI